MPQKYWPNLGLTSGLPGLDLANGGTLEHREDIESKDACDPVPTNDAPVTPGHIRDSIRILVRQIVIFARTVLLDAGSRAQIWWKDRRSSILSTKAYFTDRGPKTTARLTSSTQNRWPIFNLKSLFESWREVAGSLKSKWPRRLRGLSVRPRRVAAAFALASVLFSGFVLYWVATLPLNGGLQVEATQAP
jgi:hypothetical protein